MHWALGHAPKGFVKLRCGDVCTHSNPGRNLDFVAAIREALLRLQGDTCRSNERDLDEIQLAKEKTSRMSNTNKIEPSGNKALPAYWLKPRKIPAMGLTTTLLGSAKASTANPS